MAAGKRSVTVPNAPVTGCIVRRPDVAFPSVNDPNVPDAPSCGVLEYAGAVAEPPDVKTDPMATSNKPATALALLAYNTWPIVKDEGREIPQSANVPAVSLAQIISLAVNAP